MSQEADGWELTAERVDEATDAQTVLTLARETLALINGIATWHSLYAALDTDRRRSRSARALAILPPLGVHRGGTPMQADEIRFLFAYDRWATRRVLAVLDGLDPAAWTRTNVVGERGLGAILVHHLGASQRWRHAFQDTGATREPEREPLPTIDQLREGWEAEWAAVDEWLLTVTDGFVAYVHDGVPVWQMLIHVVNHGTQHRAEAAAMTTAEGRSPGELDLFNYAEEQAAVGSTEAPAE